MSGFFGNIMEEFLTVDGHVNGTGNSGNTVEQVIAYIVAEEIRVKSIKKNTNKVVDKLFTWEMVVILFLPLCTYRVMINLSIFTETR